MNNRKFSRDDYRSGPKRPGNRGHGMADGINTCPVVEGDAAATAEASTEDGQRVPMVRVPSVEPTKDNPFGDPSVELSLGYSAAELEIAIENLELNPPADEAEENLTDLGEQEKAMEVKNNETVRGDDEVPVPASIGGFEKPMSFTGSTINSKAGDV